MKTIATKSPAAKTSKLNGAIPHAPQGAPHADHDADTGERIYARFEKAQADVLAFFGAPTWKRTLVAFASGILLAAGGGYLWGQVVGYLMVGCLMATNSLFITILLGALALIIGSWQIGKFAARVTGAILTKEADAKAIAAYDAVTDALSNAATKLNPMSWFSAKGATAH
jgi:hypothetical protein